LATELRWILLALSVPLLLGIWWWGARRSRQAPGNAQLRESTAAAVVPARGHAPFDSTADAAHPPGGARDWGVSPFEPLSIRTADFEQVPIVDLPMTAHPDSVDEALNLGVNPPADPPPYDARGAEAGSAPRTAIPAAMPVPRAAAPAPPAAPPPAEPAATDSTPQGPKASEMQHIVSVRIAAAADARWTGSRLLDALESHGLAFGRYQVFHRRHSDGRTVFCAASLIEPGTFDLARMPGEEFRGLTLFAVLPGPLDPQQTLDALIQTAGELAATLRGTLQDSKGLPLSQQRALALRDEVARFQALLTMT
jgi:FtsZ-interacting cell division protein ZipA